MTNPQAAPSPSDPYFEGLTYGRAWNAFWARVALGVAEIFAGIDLVRYQATR